MKMIEMKVIICIIDIVTIAIIIIIIVVVVTRFIAPTKILVGQQKKYIHIPQPHLNLSYNSNMGGVDLLDNGEKNYAITTRIRKWYWSVYSWFLNISMVQSWRLYREHMKERSRLLQLQQEEDIIKLRERMVELGYDKSDITRDIKEQERQAGRQAGHQAGGEEEGGDAPA